MYIVKVELWLLETNKTATKILPFLATLVAVYLVTTNQITWKGEILIYFQQRWGQTRQSSARAKEMGLPTRSRGNGPTQ